MIKTKETKQIGVLPLRYPDMREAVFLSRPNRFIAHCRVDGQVVTAHVKNTGRCRELLIPGTRVWLQHHDDPARKTAWSLITVQKGELLINMDSQAPNALAEEALRAKTLLLPGFSAPDLIRREQRFGDSRFDFYLEQAGRGAFMEVKGVTLEEDGLALFPDAPTQRGVRHIQELQKALAEGYGAFLLFVVQMEGMRGVSPNDKTHPEFGQALRAAGRAGVKIMAVECHVWPNRAEVYKEVEVLL